MSQNCTFATVGLLATLMAGVASAQTAPAADPHAGHTMPAVASRSVPQAASAADPHAGHSMPANAHAGHDMSTTTGMGVPAPTGTPLKASSPAAGAMLMGSPRAISLTLPHAMTMDSVALTNAAGQRIPLSATLTAGPIETLTTPVPALVAGTYTVAWTASAGTNDIMAGTFAFMIH